MGGYRPFFGEPELAPALMVCKAVTLFFDCCWYSLLVDCFFCQEDQLQLAIAFDSLWQFPNENPIETTMRGQEALIHEVKSYGEEVRRIRQSKLDEAENNDPQSRELFNPEGYRATFGAFQGQQLIDEVHKLEEWYSMRRFLQIDSMDDRVSIELAMVVAFLSLVPYLCTHLYRCRVGEEMSLQALNFVSLWDFSFLMYFVLKALMNTVAFNDLYEQHHNALQALMDQLRVDCARERASNKRPSLRMGRSTVAPDDDASSPSELGFGALSPPHIHVDVPWHGAQDHVETIKYVEMYVKALERFDAPLSLFGMTMNRKVVTGFISSVLMIMAPQLWVLVDRFLS